MVNGISDLLGWRRLGGLTRDKTFLINRPLHRFATPNRAADLFPLFCSWLSFQLSSRIKPLLEMRLEALEHLFFYVFDVGEPVPTSDIAVFTVTLKLQNEFFH